MDAIDTAIWLWKKFQQPGWDIKPVPQKGIVIFEVPDATAATELLTNFCSVLATSAALWKCSYALVRHPGCFGGYAFKIPSSIVQSHRKDENITSSVKAVVVKDYKSVDFSRLDNSECDQVTTKSENVSKHTSLFVGVMRITPALMPWINYILENPDKKLGITRINDDSQLMLSEKAAVAMDSQGEEAVGRKTPDFWLAEDLENLKQMYRDCGANSFEVTYLASTNKSKHNVDAHWARFVTRYRLIEDGFGVVYRLGENIDLVPVERPAIVH